MYYHILHPIRLDELARSWLLEDTNSFNFAGVVGREDSIFEIFMNTNGVLAGIPFVNAVFKQLGVTPFWYNSDGDEINSMTKIGKVCGPAEKVLLAERTVLNVLSRASGIATVTHKMQEVLKKSSWKGILAGTHNTTPGFKIVEKYALLVGGADMHRYDLSNFIMLKNNHIAIAGSIEKAVDKVREVNGFSLKIEVQCKSIEQAQEAGNASCDIIMLDNFKPEEVLQHAPNLKLQYPSILIEARGEISELNIKEYASPSVDVISSNSLIQGYPTLGFTMSRKGNDLD